MLFITIFASIFLHSNVILLDWKVFYVFNYVYFVYYFYYYYYDLYNILYFFYENLNYQKNCNLEKKWSFKN